jgi:hypothetical protein
MWQKIKLYHYPPLSSLDMCNAIQLQKDIRENYAEARAGDRVGFFVAPRACPSSTGGTSDAISEGSKRQPGRPAARIAQSPDSGNGIWHPLNPRLRNHCKFIVVYNEPNSALAKVAVHGKCCTANAARTISRATLGYHISGLAISPLYTIGPLADNSTLRCAGRDAGGAD